MFILIYRLFLQTYSFVIWLASLFKEKARLWVKGRERIFEKIQESLKPNEERIWFHCSSVGEFEQARPLIEAIKLTSPNKKIFLTFFSPSGYELRKNYKQADYVFYLPLDGKMNARRLVALVKPTLVVFVKYEFWYYYLTTLRNNRVPTVLIAATFRASQPFFKWYGNLHNEMLGCFTQLFLHDEASAKLLEKIGFKENVTVAGDTRYDRVSEIAQQAKSYSIIEVFKGDEDRRDDASRGAVDFPCADVSRPNGHITTSATIIQRAVDRCSGSGQAEDCWVTLLTAWLGPGPRAWLWRAQYWVLLSLVADRRRMG